MTLFVGLGTTEGTDQNIANSPIDHELPPCGTQW
jgi:hypothetical protein